MAQRRCTVARIGEQPVSPPVRLVFDAAGALADVLAAAEKALGVKGLSQVRGTQRAGGAAVTAAA